VKKRPKKLAAIDVGTNSFHLIVAETVGKKFRIIDKEKETVRLGGGSMKRLSADAMKRGVRTIKMFSALAELEGATVKAVATSAVREASNRRVFLNEVKKRTGVKINVISGKEEARLIYLGVLSSMPVFSKKILLVDIGGGSTEILVGKKGEALYSTSLKMGAVRLTAKYFKGGAIGSAAFKSCKAYVDGLLEELPDALRYGDFDAVIGTSGTIMNLSKMIRAANGKTKKDGNGVASFSRAELLSLADMIFDASGDTRELERIPGLDPGRVDIITAGALILREVFKKLHLKGMTVCKTALREGIVMDAMGGV